MRVAAAVRVIIALCGSSVQLVRSKLEHGVDILDRRAAESYAIQNVVFLRALVYVKLVRCHPQLLCQAVLQRGHRCGRELLNKCGIRLRELALRSRGLHRGPNNAHGD